jgi:acyl-CoA thioester hydrolase
MGFNIKKINYLRPSMNEVRDYEVDFQGIVNNAVYMNYLAQARAKFLENMGYDVVKIAQEGINIVLFASNLKFKSPLKYRDTYSVTTELLRISKFKLVMSQTIINTKTGIISVEAENYLCCVDTKTGKPCLHQAFEEIAIANNKTTNTL